MLRAEGEDRALRETITCRGCEHRHASALRASRYPAQKYSARAQIEPNDPRLVEILARHRLAQKGGVLPRVPLISGRFLLDSDFVSRFLEPFRSKTRSRVHELGLGRATGVNSATLGLKENPVFPLSRRSRDHKGVMIIGHVNQLVTGSR